VTDDLFERAQSVEIAPSGGLATVLQLFFAATSAQTGVILALDRSEEKPTYRRLIHLFVEGANAGFLVANEYVEVKELRLQKEPWLIPAIEVRLLGPVWQQFFRGDVLAVPISGKPLCPIREAPPAAATGLGAVALLGPIVGGSREWHTRAGKDRLAAIAAIAARCIGKRDAEQALELVVKATSSLCSNVERPSALEFGVSLLRALRQAVPFRVGVLYLRNLKSGGDRYLVYSAALGEDDRALLKSFWSQAERAVHRRTAGNRSRTLGRRQRHVGTV